MYSIFSDGVCIYDDAVPVEGEIITEPKLTMEDNSAGSLVFTMPPGSIGYTTVKKFTSNIVVKRDGNDIWSGRVISESEDFWKNRQVTCEGALAYLNDTIQPPHEYNVLLRSFLEAILNVHNAKVDARRRFTIGVVTVLDNQTDGLYKATNFNTTWEAVSALLDVYGGHLRVRRENNINYLDYFADYPVTSTQEIRFGENLLEFTQNFDYTDLATVIIPQGERIEPEVERIGDLVNLTITRDKVINEDNRIVSSGDIELDFKENCCPSPYTGTIMSGRSIMFDADSGKYIDEKGKIKDTPNPHYVLSHPIAVNGGDVFYYSGRMDNGYIMWMFKNAAGKILNYKSSSSGSLGYTDCQQSKIEAPPGAKTLRIAGFGTELRLELYKENNNYVCADVMVEPGDIYRLRSRVIGNIPYVVYKKKNGTIISRDQGDYAQVNNQARDIDVVITIPQQCKEITISGIKANTHFAFENLNGKYMVANAISVKPLESYFYSASMNNGYGMWFIKDKDGNVIDSRRAANEAAWTDARYDEIQIPERGVSLVVAGYDYDIDQIDPEDEQIPDSELPVTNALQLNREKPREDELDHYVTIESVNDGKMYIESPEAIALYGRVERVVSWDEVSDEVELLALAQLYLTDLQFENMVIQLTAVDLHYLTDDVAAFNYLDSVRCVSEPHNMDRYFPITKIEIPLDDVANTKFTLGVISEKSLTGESNRVRSDLIDRIAAVPTRKSLLQDAKDNATAIMKMANNGFVTTVVENGVTKEHIIADHPDYLKARRLWRWNINGLGYSKTGYDGEYGLAMTMDGAIVADYITTGTLNADRIRAGFLTDLQGLNFWNLETGDFSLQTNTTIGDKTLSEHLSESLDLFANTVLADDVNELQEQIDGKVDTWYYSYTPTSSRLPESAWAAEEKEAHIGDIFYDKSSGKTYRYAHKINGVAIDFTSASQTEAKYDKITFYWRKDDKIYRSVEYSGLDLGGKSVFIPSQQFYIYWHSDNEKAGYYGFAFTNMRASAGEDNGIEVNSLPAYSITTLTVGTLPESAHPYVNNTDKMWYADSNITVDSTVTDYMWAPITDPEIGTTMSIAAKAQDTADGKRRVFTSTPTPPYDVGDLWCEGISGDIKTCVTARAQGASYNASDFQKKNKYTDDTAVNTLNNDLDQDGVWYRLSHNSSGQLVKGIWLDASANTLYMSADYISTGVLRDPGQNTKFNLSTGEFTMKKGSIRLGDTYSYTQMSNDGHFQSFATAYYGSLGTVTEKLDIFESVIKGYANNTYIGLLDLAAQFTDDDGDLTSKHVVLAARNGSWLRLQAKNVRIYTGDNNDPNSNPEVLRVGKGGGVRMFYTLTVDGKTTLNTLPEIAGTFTGSFTDNNGNSHSVKNGLITS